MVLSSINYMYGVMPYVLT